MKHKLTWFVLSLALVLGCGKKEENAPTQRDTDAATCLKLGDVDYDDSRYKESIISYKKAIAIKPDYAEAYYNMGKAYDKLGQHADAIASFQKAIVIKTDYADAYYNMGFAYTNLEHHSKAIAAYKMGISLNPTGGNADNAHLNMGVAYYKIGQYAHAIAAFKKTSEFTKTDGADAYYQMGFAYAILEQYPEAIATYKKYIAIQPKGAFADEARRHIREIENGN
jgi:Tfp pilus assembly protein PilF